MFTYSAEFLFPSFHKPMVFKPVKNEPLNNHVDGIQIIRKSKMIKSLSWDQYDRFMTKVDVGYNISIKLDTGDVITVFLLGKGNEDV